MNYNSHISATKASHQVERYRMWSNLERNGLRQVKTTKIVSTPKNYSGTDGGEWWSSQNVATPMIKKKKEKEEAV